MKRGRLQAKDIADLDVLQTIRKQGAAHALGWTFTWELIAALPVLAPLSFRGSERLFLRKCDALVRRGLINGCTCGCRGDFTLTSAGLAFINAAPAPASP